MLFSFTYLIGSNVFLIDFPVSDFFTGFRIFRIGWRSVRDEKGPALITFVTFAVVRDAVVTRSHFAIRFISLLQQQRQQQKKIATFKEYLVWVSVCSLSSERVSSSSCVSTKLKEEETKKCFCLNQLCLFALFFLRILSLHCLLLYYRL